MLAANAPDVDVLSYTRGQYFALSFRRGITHGLPAMVVWPFLVTGVILALDRLVRRRLRPDAPPARAGPLLGWSALACLTHPALDWMNTYGMRWALPLDGRWSYGDALFIVDPWLWLVLGGALFVAARPRWPGLALWAALAALASWIVALASPSRVVTGVWTAVIVAVVLARVATRSASARVRERVVSGACGAAVLYIALMLAVDARASAQVARFAEEAGLEVEDVMVAPTPADPFQAEIEVKTADAFVPGTYRWPAAEPVELRTDDAVPLLSGPEGMAPERLTEIVDAARRDTDAAHWLVWSRYPYVRVDRDGDGWQVRFSDARYDGDGARVGGLSGVLVRLDAELRSLGRGGT